jgi:hypothetical protein
VATLTKGVFLLPSRLLLWLSGARIDILDHVPTERVKFIGIGLGISVSSVVAGASMAFALSSIQVATPYDIAIALTWGLSVLLLNRSMVASLSPVKNWRTFFLVAAPRLILSALIALIISVPLVLWLFRPEISAEIPVIQHNQLNTYLAEQKTSPLTQQIATDQAAVTNLQTTISSGGGPAPNPDTDPTIKKLTIQLDVAETALQADQKRLRCELYGGAGCPAGGGSSVQSTQAAIQADSAQISSLKGQLTKATQSFNQATLDDQAAELSAARAAFTEAEAKLQSDLKAQQDALASFTRSNNGRGILTQIKALSAISSGNATLTATQYLLLTLYMMIDLMPLLTRLLSAFGSPSTYDLILEQQDQIDIVTARRNAEIRRLAVEQQLAGFEALPAAELQRARVLRNELSSASLPALTERTVPHADGRLYRLELGDAGSEFLLVDIVDGVPTLNWTAVIGAREFALLVSERLQQTGDTEDSPGEMFISLAGIADQVGARLGVELADLASPAFDQRSEFIRFDDPDIALALQSLPGSEGERVKLFGVSAAGLNLDTVRSLMVRTATVGLSAHAWADRGSTLFDRIAELTHLPRQGDPALRWRIEGEVGNEQAQPQMP